MRLVIALFAYPLLITLACPTETNIGTNEAEVAINQAVMETSVDKMEATKDQVTEEIKAVKEVKDVTEVKAVKQVKKAKVAKVTKVEHTDATKEVKKAYFELSNQERKVVERIVAGEARGESLKGQMLVAQCILNACLKDDLSPSKVRTKYQYSGWSNDVSDSVKEAVERVFDNGETVVDEPILYFYAPKICTSTWHETLNFVIEVGCHRFFKE